MRQVDAEGEQLTVLRAARHAAAHLRAGITTVRDLSGNWDAAISIARAVDRGVLDGPTILASGRTVIMTGGHDPFWGLPCDGPDAVVRGVRMQVAADALGTDGIRNAVHAGIDTVEQGVFLTEDIVAAMAERGTVLCPTAAVYRRIAQGSAPGYAVRKATEVVAAHRESIVMARAAGLSIIAGTDAGAPGMPHPSLVEEIECLIDPGPPADFALVDGDPLADPSLLRSVWGVARRQQVVRATRPCSRSSSPHGRKAQ